MVPLFSENLDGKKQNDAYIMGARNWAAVDYVVDSGELQFDIRVEKSKGTGAQGTKVSRAKEKKREKERC